MNVYKSVKYTMQLHSALQNYTALKKIPMKTFKILIDIVSQAWFSNEPIQAAVLQTGL